MAAVLHHDDRFVVAQHMRQRLHQDFGLLLGRRVERLGHRGSQGGWPASSCSRGEAQTVWNAGPLLAIIGFDRASPAADTLDRTQFVRRSTALSRERPMRLSAALTFAGMVALASSGAAFAGDPDNCKTVRFSDVGWTDITATTAIANEILKGLGYTPKITVLSVPVTYASMKNKDIDVFLGNWQPSMENDRKPYVDDKSVIVTGANLPVGAKYTLAVPQHTYDKGLKDFGDIGKFKDSLKGKIYGIEPGNDGNRLILDIIKANKFGLKDFQVVESSEQGMLAEVQRATTRNQDIVFLGWAPHPMNVNFKIQYLTGGDDSFGPNFCGGIVYTNERAGFAAQCPNVA